MEDNKSKRILIFVIIVLSIIIFIQFGRINKTQQENELLDDEISSLEDINDELYYALDEANTNIEQANSNIEEAQYYTWESYDEMGYALESLETVDTVDSPY